VAAGNVGSSVMGSGRLIVTNRRALLLLGVVALALVVGFGVTLRGVTAVGGIRTEGHAIPLQGAAAARVELAPESGELRVGPGGRRLLDGAFTYNVAAWDPEIAYRVISREGALRIEQGDVDGPFPLVYGDTVNTWDVVLTPDVPLDLEVDLGSADGTFALGGLNLIGLEIAGDGGDVVVDLGQPLHHDLDVRLATGGDVTLTVPAEVGVRVVVAGGASVRTEALQKSGSAYVNDRYGAVPVTLTVTVETEDRVTIHQAAPLAAASALAPPLT
jgi:hypothetical protein